MKLLPKSMHWVKPSTVATTSAALCSVNTIKNIEHIHGNILPLIRKGKKQILIFFYGYSAANLKIQMIMIGTQPKLKK